MTSIVQRETPLNRLPGMAPHETDRQALVVACRLVAGSRSTIPSITLLLSQTEQTIDRSLLTELERLYGLSLQVIDRDHPSSVLCLRIDAAIPVTHSLTRPAGRPHWPGDWRRRLCSAHRALTALRSQQIVQ